MKTRSHKRLALFPCALLLISLPCVLCFVWVRKEQRQYMLDRQLIAALKLSNLKQAIALIEAGADPNTRYVPAPKPSFFSLVSQLIQHRQTALDDDLIDGSPRTLIISVYGNPTAFMIVCGDWRAQGGAKEWFYPEAFPQRLQLVRSMLRHGADVSATDVHGKTTLYWVILECPNKDVINLLLTHGSDPSCASEEGLTPLDLADSYAHPPRPDLVALLRKYRKHP